MLQLKNVKKDYITSSETVNALRGVSISFRQSEFVSILGPSGCGKTTLLNIIGGLDHYTDGDLIIGGRSTKSYSDRDWDVYRNHRVGFIFQSYNLIPHQTVLGNVELALTIAGVSREERIERAKRALDRVGLSGQYYKKPNQLSGGQCQRVAIARALVNDPEILLADEPTGALDTVTSVQIMDLIKEISDERLVIMVTHNPELAEQYSSRIVRLLDGEIIEDTNPVSDEEEAAEVARLEDEQKREEEAAFAGVTTERERGKVERTRKKKRERAKMSFFTAFMLSLKNLFTKKGRTALTSFAGSIGIIGIALILAVSQGMTAYINHVQESSLSAYPLTLESTTVDASELIASILGRGEGEENDRDAVYKDPLIAELVEALSHMETNENDLKAFKEYVEAELLKEDSPLKNAISGVQYAYDINIPIYTKNQDGEIIKSDTGEIMKDMLAKFMMELAAGGKNNTESESSNSGIASNSMMGSMMGVQMWEELLPGTPDASGNRPLINDILFEQYEVIHGEWPDAKDEIVLVLNEDNELDDLTLYALGLLSKDDIDAIIEAAASGTTLPEGGKDRWTYEEICDLTFRTIFPYNFYQPRTDGTYYDASSNRILLNALYEDAMELKVVGIIRPQENTETAMLKGSIVYTTALTEYIISEAEKSEVVKAQLANPDYDILTGLPFESASGSMSDAEKKAEFLSYVDKMSDEDKAKAYVQIQCLKAEKANLKNYTDMALARLTDKDGVVDMIVGALVQSGADVDAETVRGYFEDLSLDELKTMLRPTIEDETRKSIHQMVNTNLGAIPDATKVTMLEAELAGTSDEDFGFYYDEITAFSDSTYEKTLVKIGKVDLDSPARINLFASTFENKDVIVQAISDYNDSVSEEKKIAYTDFLGIMMSSITTIIQAITYVLIAFVAISLVVSSIMIGVITLISVQERTKEIGVLRAIGASKRDVSSMFNAETIIIGLSSGLLGVVVTYLLCIPINIILNALTGLANLRAFLPIEDAVVLVLISVFLTLFSGIIPSRSAAKKDPVVALRTE